MVYVQYASNYWYFLAIVVGALLAGMLVYWIFKHLVMNLARKTPTKFDDILIDDIEEPFVVLIVLLGLFFGARFLNMNPFIEIWYYKILMIIAVLNLAYFAIKLGDDLVEEYLVPIVEKTQTLLDDFYLLVFRRAYIFYMILLSVLLIVSILIDVNLNTMIFWSSMVMLVFLISLFIILVKGFLNYNSLKNNFFNEGDILEIPRENILGIVDKSTLYYTFLRDSKGGTIVIPNEIIRKSPLKVYKPKLHEPKHEVKEEHKKQVRK
ncbi:MAG: mechanosensitive ion channel family protein [Candidatus Woesearchaeota archaeon]